MANANTILQAVSVIRDITEQKAPLDAESLVINLDDKTSDGKVVDAVTKKIINELDIFGINKRQVQIANAIVNPYDYVKTRATSIADTNAKMLDDLNTFSAALPPSLTYNERKGILKKKLADSLQEKYALLDLKYPLNLLSRDLEAKLLTA